MNEADERTTRRLLDDLVRDLAPVRRYPSLAVALAWVLCAWGIAAGISSLLHDAPSVLIHKLAGDPWFGVCLLGLAAGAVAGSAGAIASVLPGREAVSRRAGRLAALGIGGAVLIGVFADRLGVDPVATPFAKDAGCFMLGSLVGLVPMGVLVVLERRGFVLRPVRSAVIALAGGFGLGGLAVQLFCQQAGARHMLLGHLAVPVVTVVLVAWPLAWLLSRARDRSPRRA